MLDGHHEWRVQKSSVRVQGNSPERILDDFSLGFLFLFLGICFFLLPGFVGVLYKVLGVFYGVFLVGVDEVIGVRFRMVVFVAMKFGWIIFL